MQLWPASIAVCALLVHASIAPGYGGDCPAINANFYMRAHTLLGAAHGLYGTIDPQGPNPDFTAANISQAVPYFLDSNGYVHATTEPAGQQLLVSGNVDLSGDPDTADEFQYLYIYEQYPGNSALTCKLVPTTTGGCELKCEKTIYVSALNGNKTLHRFLLCADGTPALAIGTTTADKSFYDCSKLMVEAIPAQK